MPTTKICQLCRAHKSSYRRTCVYCKAKIAPGCDPQQCLWKDFGNSKGICQNCKHRADLSEPEQEPDPCMWDRQAGNGDNQDDDKEGDNKGKKAKDIQFDSDNQDDDKDGDNKGKKAKDIEVFDV